MKKPLLILTLILFFTRFASAQFVPSFQCGFKAGADYSVYPGYVDYKNVGEAGYIVGAWARLGGLGFNFQPEMYLTSKNVNVTYTAGHQSTVDPSRFTRLDFPLLLGTKIGDELLGARFYAGPVISFAVTSNQTFGNDIGDASRLNISDQNYALQAGAGVDIKKLSIDLRYEEGLGKIPYGPSEYSHTRLNLISLTLAYSIFSVY